MARRKAPRIPDALLDQLLAGADPKTAFDANGLLDDPEMDHHLSGDETGNSRNGYGRKMVTTETGRIELEIRRDRQATFDPQLIAKYQRRFPGFDDKIISMYARGMSAREIVGHLRELSGIEASPDLVSAVTDAVLEEIAAWQARPLEPVYPGLLRRPAGQGPRRRHRPEQGRTHQRPSSARLRPGWSRASPSLEQSLTARRSARQATPAARPTTASARSHAAAPSRKSGADRPCSPA
jgi:hypothetical protein